MTRRFKTFYEYELPNHCGNIRINDANELDTKLQFYLFYKYSVSVKEFETIYEIE